MIRHFAPLGSGHVLVSALAVALLLPHSRAMAQQTMYVSDYSDGGVFTFSTGSVPPGGYSVYGPQYGPSIGDPSGITFDSAGNLYVVSPGDQTLTIIAPGGRSQNTININSTYVPQTPAVDASGNVYVSDAQNEILKFTPTGSGNYTQSVFTNRDILNASSTGFQAWELAVGPGGYIYDGDETGNVFKIAPDGLSKTTLIAGNGLTNFPAGLAFGPNGTLFVADEIACTIKEYNPSNGNFIATIATGLGFPYGIAFDAAGNLYEADNNFGPGGINEFVYNGSGSWSSTPVVFAMQNLDNPYYIAFAPEATGPSAWTGASDTTWAGTGNWTGTVPGSTSGTTNTDTALFNQSAAHSPLTIDSGRNVQNITFDTSAVGSLTLGTTNGFSLLLTGGGTVQTTSSVASSELVNAPLVLEGDYTFTSGAASNSATLSFGGFIKPGPTSGTTALTLNGSNTGANTISGILTDNGSGKLAIVKNDGGTWILSAANSYSGGTNVNNGTLRFNNTSATPATVAGTATVSNGATLELSGTASGLSAAVNVANNSTAANGLHVTGTNQVVGVISGSGNTVVGDTSAASLTAYQITQKSLSIGATGTVTLAPSGSGSNSNPAGPNNNNYSVNTLNLLSITSGGTLDVGNNGLVVAYGAGSDPYDTITSLIRSGYADGAWTGTGITSSLARAAEMLGSPTPALNIGLIDFVPNTGTFGSSIVFEGQTISTSAVLVRLTYMDDLVLSGDMAQSNATSDALFFAANYGSGTTWHVGDITHDGAIDTNDALLFAANYVVGLPSLDGTMGAVAVLGGNQAAVPEPSSMAIAMLGAFGFGLSLFTRRRKLRHD